MKLVMTLLVRDEADIVAANLDYHLARGVDLVIATDNRSVDATPEILRGYERRGVLRLLHEPSDYYAQAAWVTRMARLAAAEGADWVIHSDADEFWWPLDGSDLKSVLDEVPTDVAVVSAQRWNFPPRPEDGRPFHERMVVRDLDSRNPRGRPLRAKVAHRAHPAAEVGMGNHRAVVPGNGTQPTVGGVEILHFPMRTYAQFENKIVNGGRALNRATNAARSGGGTWRELYALWERGELRDHYEEAMLPSGPPPDGFVEDTRLRDFVAGLG